MLFNELKQYKIWVKKYHTMKKLCYAYAENINKYTQFLDIARKEYNKKADEIDNLNRKIAKNQNASQTDKLVRQLGKLKKNLTVFDNACDFVQTKLNDTERMSGLAYRDIDHIYEKMNELYEEITNKTSYKILTKMNKRYVLEQFPRLEKINLVKKYTKEDYNEFIQEEMLRKNKSNLLKVE